MGAATLFNLTTQFTGRSSAGEWWNGLQPDGDGTDTGPTVALDASLGPIYTLFRRRLKLSTRVTAFRVVTSR
jgi:hypothetical protein